MKTVQVYSIFYSIQGESTFAGFPCVFIRLAGCSARCGYCDSMDAVNSKGECRTIDSIIEEVKQYGVNIVEVTGGEPLEQENTPELLNKLLDAGHDVLLETNGMHTIKYVNDKVYIIMDIKTPGSKANGSFENLNLHFAEKKGMDIKFVITSKEDFDFAIKKSDEYDLFNQCEVLISPVEGLNIKEVAKWVLDSKRRVRLQLQQHKIIWPDSKEEC